MRTILIVLTAVLIYVIILVPRGLVALKQSDDWLISQRENPSGGEQHE